MSPIVREFSLGVFLAASVALFAALLPQPAAANGAANVIALDTVPEPSFASQASTQETMRGIVANVDERNDRISVRLPSSGTAGDVTGDFKVQDGLIFNAVRYGGEVEFIVKTIKGARTIVALRKR
jgi:Cu/Ag efflux protein CusF